MITMLLSWCMERCKVSRKANFPNLLFDNKNWVQKLQRSHYVNVDIVPCSISRVETLPTIYSYNLDSWEGCAMTCSPRCVMITSRFLLGKLARWSWHLCLWVLIGVRSYSWLYWVFQQRKDRMWKLVMNYIQISR